MSLATQLDCKRLVKICSFFSKCSHAAAAFAHLARWLLSGLSQGSQSAVGYDSNSAKLFNDLKMCMERVEDLVNSLPYCDPQDPKSFEVALTTGEDMLSDDFKKAYLLIDFGDTLVRARTMTKAILDKALGIWTTQLEELNRMTVECIIDYSEASEVLHLPKGEDMAKQLLQNEGYKKVPPLSAAILGFATTDNAYHVLPKDLVKESHGHAVDALRMASVTFTLWH
eukprot:5384744-Pyramimonas_sp.AAC.1